MSKRTREEQAHLEADIYIICVFVVLFGLLIWLIGFYKPHYF